MRVIQGAPWYHDRRFGASIYFVLFSSSLVEETGGRDRGAYSRMGQARAGFDRAFSFSLPNAPARAPPVSP